jgi:FKBP-type peptidyl-prolyl cis-trans isomerase FkpA
LRYLFAFAVSSAFAAALSGCASATQAPAVEAAPAAASSTAPRGCRPPPRRLEWKDIQLGKGEAVRFRSPVLVSYTGWLYDGCTNDLKGIEFDSSSKRVTPFGFIVGAKRVISGWDEGVIGMREGGRRMLLVPADKAYGAAGRPPKIPPDAALVFEIELVRIIHQGPGQ